METAESQDTCGGKLSTWRGDALRDCPCSNLQNWRVGATQCLWSPHESVISPIFLDGSWSWIGQTILHYALILPFWNRNGNFVLLYVGSI